MPPTVLEKAPRPRGERGGEAPAPRGRRARSRHLRHARASSTAMGLKYDLSAVGVRCMWMRGGTSKGGYLPRRRPARRHRRARRLPAARDGLARSAPDRRHGRRRSADLARSRSCRSPTRDGVDVDYLFLQVFVDQAIVTDAQNCGNILAGVGPFAIERGLVARDRRRDPGRDLHGEYRPGRDRHGRRPRAACRPMTATRGSTACRAPPRRSRSSSATPPARSCGALLPTGNAVDDDRRRRAAR